MLFIHFYTLFTHFTHTVRAGFTTLMTHAAMNSKDLAPNLRRGDWLRLQLVVTVYGLL